MVSVIIPAFNRASVLPRAIDSVLRQVYRDFELIICDDGSTDATCSLVHQYINAHSGVDITYVRNEKNEGSAKARNLGLKLAKGQFIAFLDSDDEWFPEKLKIQVHCMESFRRDWGVSHTGAKIIKNGREISYFTPDTRFQGMVYRRMALFGDVLFLTPTVMLRREVIDTVGMFDERLLRGQDAEFLLRVFERYKLIAITEPLSIVHMDTEKQLANKVHQARKVMIESKSLYIKRTLGFWAMRAFIGTNYRVISDAYLNENKRFTGILFFLKAMLNNPLMHYSYYVRSSAKLIGLKRSRRLWSSLMRSRRRVV